MVDNRGLTEVFSAPALGDEYVLALTSLQDNLEQIGLATLLPEPGYYETSLAALEDFSAAELQDLQEEMSSVGLYASEGHRFYRDGMLGDMTMYGVNAALDADFAAENLNTLVAADALDEDQLMQMQVSLNRLGFDAGKVDGVWGGNTAEALVDYLSNNPDMISEMSPAIEAMLDQQGHVIAEIASPPLELQPEPEPEPEPEPAPEPEAEIVEEPALPSVAEALAAIIGLDAAQTEILQNALNEAGFDVGAADGVFGPGTAGGLAAYLRDNPENIETLPDAVSERMARYGHDLDAIAMEADPQIATQIINAALQEDAALDANQTADLQTALNAAGYDAGTADGVFGSGTAAALSGYLQDNPDILGDVSDVLKDRLESYGHSVDRMILDHDPDAAAASVAALVGQAGALSAEDTEILQTALNTAGYDAGTPDGAFGPNTADAVASYLRDHPESIVDVSSAMDSALAENGHSLYDMGIELIPGFAEQQLAGPLLQDPYLTAGDIEQIQQTLLFAGYDAGVPDGVFGPDMTAGLQSFLTDHPEALDTVGAHLRRQMEEHMSAEESRALFGDRPYNEVDTQTIAPEDYNFPAEYSVESMQRFLQSAGYEIGRVDGAMGAGTLGGLDSLVSLYGDQLGVLDGRAPSDLSEADLEAMAPAIYEAAIAQGPDALHAEPERYTMALRATGTTHITLGGQDRPIVQGEVILRAPDGQELFMVNDGDGYEAQLMDPAEAAAMIEGGADITRPEFNSGGLNTSTRFLSMQDSSGPWNPYEGNALPGLGGGMSYGLDVRDGTLNTGADFLPSSFGDLDGNRSWITFNIIDPEVVVSANGVPRDAFGMHVDGDTVYGVNDPGPDDGTAGCIGIREEYAQEFFQFIRDMSEGEEPTRLTTLRPNDPALGPAFDHDGQDIDYAAADPDQTAPSF